MVRSPIRRPVRTCPPLAGRGNGFRGTGTLTHHEAGVIVVDVSRPSTPTEAGSFGTA